MFTFETCFFFRFASHWHFGLCHFEAGSNFHKCVCKLLTGFHATGYTDFIQSNFDVSIQCTQRLLTVIRVWQFYTRASVFTRKGGGESEFCFHPLDVISAVPLNHEYRIGKLTAKRLCICYGDSRKSNTAFPHLIIEIAAAADQVHAIRSTFCRKFTKF